MARLNLKADGKNQQILLDYLEKNASEPLAEKINAGVKTLAGCWEFIRKEARKQAMNNVAVIEDTEVFGWAVHYFEEDDIKENQPARQTPEQLRKMAVDEEQRTKEIERRNAERREAEERRKAEDAKKIAEAEAKRKAQREKAAQKAAEAAERQRQREEKANKAVAGQFSMFDLFGTEG